MKKVGLDADALNVLKENTEIYSEELAILNNSKIYQKVYDFLKDSIDFYEIL